jgi:hypothetical protein
VLRSVQSNRDKGDRMKLSTADEAKRKPKNVQGKTKKKSQKLNDPTLEGKDENKVGRVQEGTG